MFSPVVVIITLFKVFTAYRMLNSYAGLIVANAAFALTFSLWMLTGFFQSVPQEIEEAARIDGCTTARVVLKVLVPLAAPGVATTVIYTFILAWNEFIFALTFISSTRMQPLTVGLASFIGRFTIEWNLLMAGSLLATLPVISSSSCWWSGTSSRA
jgi:multiple sugar transport system permease protein